MKTQTLESLFEQAKSRRNITSFLYLRDLNKLNEILKTDIPSFLSFLEIVEIIKDSDADEPTKKEALTLIIDNNTELKTERYRFDNGKVFVYDKDHRAYLFHSRMSRKDFNALQARNGKYC